MYKIGLGYDELDSNGMGWSGIACNEFDYIGMEYVGFGYVMVDVVRPLSPLQVDVCSISLLILEKVVGLDLVGLEAGLELNGSEWLGMGSIGSGRIRLDWDGLRPSPFPSRVHDCSIRN